MIYQVFGFGSVGGTGMHKDVLVCDQAGMNETMRTLTDIHKETYGGGNGCKIIHVYSKPRTVMALGNYLHGKTRVAPTVFLVFNSFEEQEKLDSLRRAILARTSLDVCVLPGIVRQWENNRSKRKNKGGD